MEWWHVYLFTRLDVINGVSIVFMVVSLIAVVVSGIIMWANIEYGEEDRDFKGGKKVFKSVCPVAVIATFLVIAVPSQKEAAAIYLLPKVVNSEAAKEAAKLPESAVKILKLKMDEWISDLTPNKEK